jgi:hypothetical protein
LSAVDLAMNGEHRMKASVGNRSTASSKLDTPCTTPSISH